MSGIDRFQGITEKFTLNGMSLSKAICHSAKTKYRGGNKLRENRLGEANHEYR